MKPSFLSVFVGFLFPFFTWAQMNEQFASKTLSSDWGGNVSCFSVSDDGRLVLNDQEALGECYLFTPSTVVNNAEWSMSTSFDFIPSGTNYVKYYLMSDSPVLNEALNGYFLQIGNAKKQILLYKQKGKSSSKLAASAENRLDTSVVNLTVKILRNDKGEWKVFSKLNEEMSFTEEFTAVDSTWKTSCFSGMFCCYSKTRATEKIFFDDIVIKGDKVVDNQSPTANQFVLTDSSLQVSFSERILEGSLKILMEEPIEYSCTWNNQATLLSFSFKEPLSSGTKYRLSLSDITDVYGNTSDTSYVFAKTDTVAYQDLLFSEILFNPNEDGNEYVEIYNNSDKVIDLSLLKLSTRRSSDSSIYASKAISVQNPLIFPHEYRVLTASKDGICNFYDCPETDVFVVMKSFPTLPNTSGCVVLFRAKDTMLIDEFYYNDDMHSEYVPNKGKGTSLERVSMSENLWISAAESFGQGTPGIKNSAMKTSNHDIELNATKICYPYYDENNHFVLNYKLDHGGYIANVTVYSVQGVPVATMASNLTLSTEGELRWNGSDYQGKVLPSAPYIVRFEAFSTNGDIVKESFVVVVSH